MIIIWKRFALVRAVHIEAKSKVSMQTHLWIIKIIINPFESKMH